MTWVRPLVIGVWEQGLPAFQAHVRAPSDSRTHTVVRQFVSRDCRRALPPPSLVAAGQRFASLFTVMRSVQSTLSNAPICFSAMQGDFYYADQCALPHETPVVMRESAKK